MSHFLIYAARLQDAGITRLLVTIDTADDRTRIMHVSAMLPIGSPLAKKYPTRTFELCGTDRVLESIQDDMHYSDGGPTAEKVQAAIAVHPILADDLREWFADYLLCPPPTDEEIDAAEVTEAELQRSVDNVKSMMRGLDIARQRDAMKASGGEGGG